MLDERALTIFEAAETIVLLVYPEISALKAMHGLLDYLNEAGSIDARAHSSSTISSHGTSSSDATSRRPSAPRSPSTCRTTRTCSSTSRRSTRACRSSWRATFRRREHLVKLSTAAFGADGFVVPATVPQKKGRLFGLGRRA